ncbi:MAG: hypothetical protein PHR66_13240 [Desulfuromonadaceae bacterium]|nr:hypothetical protein [Desulfuromonadaceae bacterium]
MVRKFLSLVLLALSLSACATSYKQLDNNPAFTSHQYKSADMDISWKSVELNNTLLIEGTITNPSENYVYKSLELEAIVLGNQGKFIGKQISHFLPTGFKGPESFKMNIPLENDMLPESIKFNYRYSIDEDQHSVNFDSKP